MKTVNRFLNYVRYGMSSKLILVGVFMLALAGAVTTSVVNNKNAAYAADCSANAIVTCGVDSTGTLLSKYNQNAGGDLQAILHAYGINGSNIGQMVSGVAHKDGTITVNGKVVATGAKSIGRSAKAYSHTKVIAGKTYHESASQDVFNSNSINVFVLMNGNSFVNAVILDCGNPITGTPVTPAPQPEAVCDSLELVKVDRTHFRMTGTAHGINGGTVSNIAYYVYDANNNVVAAQQGNGNPSTVTIEVAKPGNYTARAIAITSVGNRISTECTKPLTVEAAPQPEAVCDSLELVKVDRTHFRMTGTAHGINGGTVSNIAYYVYDANNNVVAAQQGNGNPSTVTIEVAKPGNYTARAIAITSVGNRISTECTKPLTVEAAPQPEAECVALTITKIDRTSFKVAATGSTKNGATISSFKFVAVDKDGKSVATASANATNNAATSTIKIANAGNYTVKATAVTSLGEKSAAACEKPVTVEQPPVTPKPGISVDKKVENVEYKRVGVNVEYNYQIKVTNTGNVALTNVKVTDTPQAGITLVSASAGSISGNVWTYTIPALQQGTSSSFILKAKVPAYKAGMLKNTVCVDAPGVPGNPDDCDTADVDVPEPGKVEVCDPTTGKTITVDEDKAGNYPPVGSEECAPAPVKVEVCDPTTGKTITVDEDKAGNYPPVGSEECAPVVPPTTTTTPPPATPETPAVLPSTGPADFITGALGLGSITGGGLYWFRSRRNLLGSLLNR